VVDIKGFVVIGFIHVSCRPSTEDCFVALNVYVGDTG
jgi:hypothetical protein